jgi:hypothetical protein
MTIYNTTSKNIYITDGPSASALIDAFKYAFDKENGQSARFTANGHSLYVQVLSLEHESGSGQTFNIECFLQNIRYHPQSSERKSGQHSRGITDNCKMRVSYSARTHYGAIHFINDKEREAFQLATGM